MRLLGFLIKYQIQNEEDYSINHYSKRNYIDSGSFLSFGDDVSEECSSKLKFLFFLHPTFVDTIWYKVLCKHSVFFHSTLFSIGWLIHFACCIYLFIVGCSFFGITTCLIGSGFGIGFLGSS